MDLIKGPPNFFEEREFVHSSLETYRRCSSGVKFTTDPSYPETLHGEIPTFAALVLQHAQSPLQRVILKGMVRIEFFVSRWANCSCLPTDAASATGGASGAVHAHAICYVMFSCCYSKWVQSVQPTSWAFPISTSYIGRNQQLCSFRATAISARPMGGDYIGWYLFSCFDGLQMSQLVSFTSR